MIQIQPLLAQPVDTDRLSQGLLLHMAASGIPLPEDECVLERLRLAVRYGHTNAALIVYERAACGIAAWHVEDRIGTITVFYVLPDVPAAAVHDLVSWVLDDLAMQGPLDGTVAELPEVTPHTREVLARSGFVGAERILMELPLNGFFADTPILLPSDYRLMPWQDGLINAAADVIYRANIGTADALLVPELRSLAATQRIVELSLQGRYGLFDRTASGFIFQADDAVGVTLVTQRRSGQGFTAEICVLPEHRRQGLAYALMLHTQAAQQSAGLPSNTLGVTANNPAYRLYHRLGYRPIGSVWTYIYPCPAEWAAFA